MAKKKSRNYKITITIILFAMVFLYLGYHMISYISNDNLSIYKVKEITSLGSNDTFTGLILREEEAVASEGTGYINYYLANGSKCAVDDIAYSIDENGSFNNSISSHDGTTSLSNENLSTMTDMLTNFATSYSGTNFSDAYNLKTNISSSLIGFLNVTDEESLKELGVDTRYFKAYKLSSSGIIEYYTDGYETLAAEDVTKESFDQSNYNKESYKNGDTVSVGDMAYKLITNEKWSIIIQLDDEQAEKYSEKERLPIEFSEYGLKTTALYEQFKGSDGNMYGKLTLSKYMIQYAQSRFLDITIRNDNVSGLKIPKSAITTKEYFKIPVSYLTKGGGSDLEGFNIETVTTDGNSATFKSCNIAYEDDEYVYVSKDEIEIGSVLLMPDSDEKIAVSTTSNLYGVYQVNQGYAVFKIVSIIDEDSDYAIVNSTGSYTITVYDMIMLDASTISEGEKIY